MRAIVQHAYGSPIDVLQLAEVDRPSVGDGEALVRVVASSANPWDWHFIRGEPVLLPSASIGGIRKPRFLIPGGDLAGTIEQVGSGVTGFGADRRCTASVTAPSLNTSPSRTAASPPQTGQPDVRAGRCGSAVRRHRTPGVACRQPPLRAGQHLLIIGASGGVGTFAVQIAKHLGAEVTGVCSTANVDVVRGLGADHVLDYRTQDITGGPARGLPARRDLLPGRHPQDPHPHGTLIQPLGEGGRWFGPLGHLVRAAALNPFVGQTLKSFTAKETTQTLDELRELIEARRLAPVIHSAYPLAEAAQAVHLVEQGSPAGKVIGTVASAPTRPTPD